MWTRHRGQRQGPVVDFWHHVQLLRLTNAKISNRMEQAILTVRPLIWTYGRAAWMTITISQIPSTKKISTQLVLKKNQLDVLDWSRRPGTLSNISALVNKTPQTFFRSLIAKIACSVNRCKRCTLMPFMHKKMTAQRKIRSSIATSRTTTSVQNHET